jgi:hypothetical protein
MRRFETVRKFAFATCVFALTLQLENHPAMSSTTPANTPPAQPPARGSFDVKVTPQTADPVETAAALGRLSLDKTFHGDLEAKSQGVMLSAGTEVEGSAGYVAIERAAGTLRGRQGGFVLQHLGTMKGGAFELTIRVLPDSGTGALAGLAGEMQIHIAPDGAHTYTLDYVLPRE